MYAYLYSEISFTGIADLSIGFRLSHDLQGLFNGEDASFNKSLLLTAW